MRPAEIRDAAGVDALIARLYPGARLGEREGVLHVTAQWRAPEGGLVTMRINEHTPRSEHDFFVLNLARARADAILSTGRNLRMEPTLRFGLQGAAAGALAQWRRDVAGRTEPPCLLILTSGRDLDFDHPAFHDETKPVVVTGRGAAEALSPPSHVEVVGIDAPSMGATIEQARERGARVVSLEAGPTSVRPLYGPPCTIDELMLSTFEEPSIPDEVRGPELLSLATLESVLGRSTTPASVSEASGTWSFRLLPATRERSIR